MKKVLFLMLFLLVLGAVNVKAQVRIGGNTAPSAAAVLDLNASDATNNGTKGLALPRVNLTSNTMQLTSGVANLTGMLVYNTTATLGATGIYYWNGATWANASLPSTSAGDSGRYIRSNGTTWVSMPPYSVKGIVDTIYGFGTPKPMSWTAILDTSWVSTKLGLAGDVFQVYVPGLTPNDICFQARTGIGLSYLTNTNFLVAVISTDIAVGSVVGARCYRPSI